MELRNYAEQADAAQDERLARSISYVSHAVLPPVSRSIFPRLGIKSRLSHVTSSRGCGSIRHSHRGPVIENRQLSGPG